MCGAATELAWGLSKPTRDAVHSFEHLRTVTPEERGVQFLVWIRPGGGLQRRRSVEVDVRHAKRQLGSLPPETVPRKCRHARVLQQTVAELLTGTNPLGAQLGLVTAEVREQIERTNRGSDVELGAAQHGRTVASESSKDASTVDQVLSNERPPPGTP